VVDVEPFGLIVLVAALAALAAVLSNRISGWLRIPAPVLFLVCAAAASDVFPLLGGLSTTSVQRIVTVALVVVLFDGGMHIGWKRFRTAARWCGVPMREVEPTPWSLGVRFRERPEGLRRLRVCSGAAADGQAIEDLDLGEAVWISLVIRDAQPLQVRASTVLQAGDEVLMLVDPEQPRDPSPVFTAPLNG